MPLPIFSQRAYTIAAISAAAAVLAGLLFYQASTPLARALDSNSPKTDSANTVYLSPDGAATTTAAQQNPPVEVHIAANGLTLLRGVRVLSVSGNTIKVGMTWGSSDFTWLVQTDFSTKFVNAEGEKESSANIHIGDTVTVTGKIARGGGTPVVDADIVRK